MRTNDARVMRRALATRALRWIVPVALLHLCVAASVAQQATPIDDPLHRLAVDLAGDESADAQANVARDAALGDLRGEAAASEPAAQRGVEEDVAAPASGNAMNAASELADVAAAPRRRLGASSAEGDAVGMIGATNANEAPTSNWILQTVTALGVVIGLILLLRYAWTRMTGQVTATGTSPVLEVLSRTTIAPRNQVLLVRLGQRILVVGDSPAGLRTLANLDDAEEVASLLTAVSAAKPNSISQNFAQLFNRFNGDYETEAAAVEGGDESEFRIDRARHSVSGLLSRLRRAGSTT